MKITKNIKSITKAITTDNMQTQTFFVSVRKMSRQYWTLRDSNYNLHDAKCFIMKQTMQKWLL